MVVHTASDAIRAPDIECHNGQETGPPMNKILLGLAATAAIAIPVASISGSASAAPVPAEKATGTVTWDYNHGQVTGTVRFDANNKTGGTLDYQASNGMWLHGVVTP